MSKLAFREGSFGVLPAPKANASRFDVWPTYYVKCAIRFGSVGYYVEVTAMSFDEGTCGVAFGQLLCWVSCLATEKLFF